MVRTKKNLLHHTPSFSNARTKNISLIFECWQQKNLWFFFFLLKPKRPKLVNSRTPWDLKHFGNPKNENLLRSPKFYEENEFLVEICRSQLITEILSFFCFHKNFMTNLSFKIVKELSRVQLFWRYPWIWLTP